jgi:hypothetical protein
MRSHLRSFSAPSAISAPFVLSPCLVLLVAALSLVGSACTPKGYACPEGEKDKSQLEKWRALGVPTDKPGIVVCEASEQNFSAAIPSPPGGIETVKALETKWKSDGWQDSPLKTYTPRIDDKTASLRYEKCGEPQNPLGERFMDCTGTLAIELSDLPSTLVGKPFLLWVDHRPTVKAHHVLTGTGR